MSSQPRPVKPHAHFGKFVRLRPHGYFALVIQKEGDIYLVVSEEKNPHILKLPAKLTTFAEIAPAKGFEVDKDDILEFELANPTVRATSGSYYWHCPVVSSASSASSASSLRTVSFKSLNSGLPIRSNNFVQNCASRWPALTMLSLVPKTYLLDPPPPAQEAALTAPPAPAAQPAQPALSALSAPPAPPAPPAQPARAPAAQEEAQEEAPAAAPAPPPPTSDTSVRAPTRVSRREKQPSKKVLASKASEAYEAQVGAEKKRPAKAPPVVAASYVHKFDATKLESPRSFRPEPGNLLLLEYLPGCSVVGIFLAVVLTVSKKTATATLSFPETGEIMEYPTFATLKESESPPAEFLNVHVAWVLSTALVDHAQKKRPKAQ